VERMRAVQQCPNCGATISPNLTVEASSDGPVGGRCPVCQMSMTSPAPERRNQLASAEDLGSRLSSLVELARNSGLPADEIVQVLRDELAFTAELAHLGRQMFVQIIDLGPQEGMVADPAAPDGRDLLLSRGRAADRPH
jgi:hypothetical protein